MSAGAIGLFSPLATQQIGDVALAGALELLEQIAQSVAQDRAQATQTRTKTGAAKSPRSRSSRPPTGLGGCHPDRRRENVR